MQLSIAYATNQEKNRKCSFSCIYAQKNVLKMSKIRAYMELFLCIYGTNRERMSYMRAYMQLFLHICKGKGTNASGAVAFLLRLLSQRRSLLFRFGLVAHQLHAVLHFSLCSLPGPTRWFQLKSWIRALVSVSCKTFRPPCMCYVACIYGTKVKCHICGHR